MSIAMHSPMSLPLLRHRGVAHEMLGCAAAGSRGTDGVTSTGTFSKSTSCSCARNQCCPTRNLGEKSGTWCDGKIKAWPLSFKEFVAVDGWSNSLQLPQNPVVSAIGTRHSFLGYPWISHGPGQAYSNGKPAFFNKFNLHPD